MHPLASVLFGAVLAGLVYGLSFLPSASLAVEDEAEEAAILQSGMDVEAGAPEMDASEAESTR